MGSLENPLVKCHTIRSFLKTISRIYCELIDHENTIPKCEVCWENHAEFNSIKAQLFLLEQENTLNKDRETVNGLSLDQVEIPLATPKDDPLTVMIVKEEQELQEDSADNYNMDCSDKDVAVGEDETTTVNHSDQEDDITKPLGYTLFTTHKKNATLKCALCDKGFLRKKSLIAHMRTHVEEAEEISNASTVEELESFEKTEDRTCKICQKKFNTSKGLTRHMKCCANKKDLQLPQDTKEHYPCDVCGKPFRNSTVLERHKEFRESANLTCDICNELFCTVKDLQNHKKFVHKINTSFQCNFCNEEFTNFRLIFRHHKMKHPLELAPESPFLCEMCGLAMMDLRDLNRHMMTLHGLNRFMCQVCRKTFRLESEYEKHRRSHIPTSQLQDLYACDVCPKKFRIERSLVKHKLLHTGETVEMFCQMCRKRFTNVQKLDQHVQKHSEESSRPFKCDICIRAFKEIKLLNQHRRHVHNILPLGNPKTKCTKK